MLATIAQADEVGPADNPRAADEPNVVDLDAVLQLLPACRRCRRSKRRCDTRLPACLNCSRVGAECIFFDHVSKELLPRTYISSLVDHVKALEAANARIFSSSSGSTSGAVPEHHFVPVRGAYRYLGQGAPLATQVGRIATKSSDIRTKTVCPALPNLRQGPVGHEMHRYLVNRYCETVHGLYPIIDGVLPYLEEPPDSLSALAPSESFVLHMVYSIACHCLPGNDCQLLLLSDVFYRQALVHVERITAELNLEALQAVSLLALRSTFDAQNGNLGQQIAFAHRLEVELSAREVEDTTTPALRRLRTSIFSLGNQVATVLDRPSGHLLGGGGIFRHLLVWKG